MLGYPEYVHVGACSHDFAFGIFRQWRGTFAPDISGYSLWHAGGEDVSANGYEVGW
jgi:hypothetical protein